MQDQDKFKTELIEELASLRRQVAELQELDRLRREMQERLWQSEEEFRDLFENAPVGYMELDTEGRITRVNASELLMLGYTEEEMLGRYIWDFVKQREGHRSWILARTRDAQPLVSAERTYLRKDGAEVPVLVQNRQVRDMEGRVVGLRSAVQDISERRRAEEQLRQALVREQRDEAARKMLLVLMHEVYNPLTGIVGNLSLLGAQKLPPDTRQCLEEIQQCAQRIHAVLKDLAKLNLTEPSPITGV
ncbi:MAG: PAS domain S-box protein [Acidobacteria bacterium]|nr:PAS domain S-box protein [Acidobacteriota bacterium]